MSWEFVVQQSRKVVHKQSEGIRIGVCLADGVPGSAFGVDCCDNGNPGRYFSPGHAVPFRLRGPQLVKESRLVKKALVDVDDSLARLEELQKDFGVLLALDEAALRVGPVIDVLDLAVAHAQLGLHGVEDKLVADAAYVKQAGVFLNHRHACYRDLVLPQSCDRLLHKLNFAFVVSQFF